MSVAASLEGGFLVGTSWKMNKTRAEARHWIEAVHRSDALDGGTLRPFVAPPFTALAAVRDALERSAARSPNTPPMTLGAQTMSHLSHGADTGEVSAAMLVDAGCGFVVLGHAERRARHAEHDAAIAHKVRLALDHGLTPLVCVGDDAAERDAGAGTDVVRRQSALALSQVGAHERARCWLAYEPLWAIGEGSMAADPASVGDVLAALRERHPESALLYGGSVDAVNAAAFTRLDVLDGLFVGRAALDPDGFVAIARAVTGALPARPTAVTNANEPSHAP